MFIIRRNILLLFILSAICSAGEVPVRTDREVMIFISDSLMSSIAADVKNFPSVVLSEGKDSSASFFHPHFVHGLTKRNVPLFLKSDSTSTTLDLNVQGSSVFYGDVFTESFFGERQCKRSITITLTATISSNSDGKILLSHSYTLSNIDTVAYSTVDQLSSSVIPAARYTRPELSFYDIVLEPAIVTVASGIIIYLFFTIRS
ncbi:MAG: hypothetical protein ACOYNS_04050 [Bacteroidota bacterium]